MPDVFKTAAIRSAPSSRHNRWGSAAAVSEWLAEAADAAAGWDRERAARLVREAAAAAESLDPAAESWKQVVEAAKMAGTLDRLCPGAGRDAEQALLLAVAFMKSAPTAARRRAASRVTDPDALRRLAVDGSLTVSRAVASNPDAPDDAKVFAAWR